MKFAIIDKDKAFAEKLRIKITEVCLHYGHEAVCTYYENTLKLVPCQIIKEFDAVFLNLQKADSPTLQLANAINKIKGINSKPYVILMSSDNSLVFDALKTLPFTFIRKSNSEDIELSAINLCQKLYALSVYTIKNGRNVRTLETAQIIRIEKQKNYSVFYTSEGTFNERCTIDEIHGHLYSFLRPHIGALLNPQHIKEYHKNLVVMSDNSIIAVSRNYRKEFRSEINLRFKSPH